MLLVADPAIGAILAAEAVFERVLALDEKISDLGLDPGQIFGMDALAPEIRVIEVVARSVAEQRPNVIADEDRREIVSRLEAVDHRRRDVEQPRQPLLHRGLEIDEPPLRSLLGLARRLVQDLFNDFGDGSGVDRAFGAPQHLYERGGSRIGAFSQCGHEPNHLASVASAGSIYQRRGTGETQVLTGHSPLLFTSFMTVERVLTSRTSKTAKLSKGFRARAAIPRQSFSVRPGRASPDKGPNGP